MRARPPVITACAVAAAILLAGCAAGTATGGPSTAPPASDASGAAATASPSPTAATSSGPAAQSSSSPPAAVRADGRAWEHVHALALDGSRVVVGTHRGLWAQDPGEAPVRVSETAFDVMGLTRDGDRWLASGHPGQGEPGPADLGLQESVDGGVSWKAISLAGEVDFHRLTASAGTVLGQSAHDGALLRSTDGGITWENLGTPPLFDLVLSPDDPRTVLGTTEDGPVRSTDGGRSFQPVPDAPLLAFLAWAGGSAYGLAPDGRLHVSTDDGRSWTSRGSAGKGRPGGLAADSDTVVALMGDAVTESRDGGATFDDRLILDGAAH